MTASPIPANASWSFPIAIAFEEVFIIVAHFFFHFANASVVFVSFPSFSSEQSVQFEEPAASPMFRGTGLSNQRLDFFILPVTCWEVG